MTLRQPHHLRHPLTPSQVESLDEMLYELYKRLAFVESTSDTGSSSTGTQGPPGQDGADGEPGADGPPGRDGVNTTLESRVILTGETRTIADTYDRIYASYLAIQGTGLLVIQGDGALAIL